jgi:hypothetical protein
MRKLAVLSIASFLIIGTLAADVAFSDQPDSRAEHSKWLGPDGGTLPFTEDEEILEFLRTAKIIKSKVITSGKNRPLKLRLEKDGVEANAIFRTVDFKQDWTKIYGKEYREFHDSCFYECAAYETSRLLGLDNVPPCVIRSIRGNEGTIQLWVENAETMKGRLEEEASESDGDWAGERQRHWARQGQVMRVFDALIDNFDRNTGNMLLDARDKLWFIDHTRSFTISTKAEVDKIVWCERGMLEKMKALDKKLLRKHLGYKVEPRRILALIERRDKIVEHIEGLIAERGEESVLFDATP